MKQHSEIPYWITLAHLSKWGTEKINRLVVKIVHDNQMSLETFFHSENEWKDKFALSDTDILDLQNAKSELPNNAFLAEDLLSQGFEVVPINSPEYSKTLKANLKLKAPTILYVKGNKQIMQANSIAIVGSRDADDISLQFTDNIAKKASQQFRVVVSGFAKGVDKQALDSAIQYKGQSIIVLPQGIMTFGSGIKKYYKEITAGDVLVLSTFHPKSVWSAGLAMARNPIIYALATEIYVAQSSESGGTWAGVIDGLKKGRTILVRKPNQNEKNANLILIEKGAKAVDFEGNAIENIEVVEAIEKPNINGTSKKNEIDEVIILLEKQTLTPKQILEKVKLNMSDKELAKKLKSLPNIQTVKKSNKIHYFVKQESPTLFAIK
ncbi:DNA-processing protein DprA [Thermoflexibacter ruber]|uniref:Predicted Rossmann fold nucleotide-binding protein DprA/Smf involved in DNA uptake n=1 Tax=Thermoflexibacter ruber TaxID=1003 RepID=A0A1I2KAE2_9BACT|nr:DNA-processing protein DprA [Thermoflexibacter ruber]SFF62091.1 Predicted Rossmann fold nucleotide-binding protein DprA/Smf involved in DNA uptake [Thermoflexibacter ruber]